MFVQPGIIVNTADATPPPREIGDAEMHARSARAALSLDEIGVSVVVGFGSEVPALAAPVAGCCAGDSVEDEDGALSEGAAAASVLAGSVEVVSVEPGAASDPVELSVTGVSLLTASPDEVPSGLGPAAAEESD